MKAKTKTRSSSAARGRRRPPAPRRNVQGPYWFDKAAADRACEFFPRFLVHTKAEWAGQPFELEKWQRNEIIRPLFGWKRRADGLRRYRLVYVEIPRKNGKSAIVAGIGLYLLHCDGEPGAEIYSLAKDRGQAAVVFDVAREMSRASAKLKSRSVILRREIFVPSTGGFYRVLSADVPTKEGLNPHAILFDELHVQDDRELWDTMRTGGGARRQPITIAMTTAGFSKKTLCGEVHDKALAVRDGLVEDDSFLPVVYASKKGDDWEDRKVWRRCNPNLGVSVKPEFLEQQYREAKESPAFQNTFRRYYLNEWVQQEFRWIDQKKWAACAGALEYQELLERLKGRACYAGLDLSTVTDLSALVLLFDSCIDPDDADYPSEEELEADPHAPKVPGFEYGDPLPSYDVLSWFWCPQEGIRIRAKKDRMPYDVWARDGWLTATEGDAVDHGAIRKKINDLGQDYLIQEVAVDAWNAHKLITELEQEDGFTIARVSQGFGSLSAPTKELDMLYRRRQIRHGGQPVLAWCADNVTLDQDPYGNWKPSKKKSRERIDGIVALVNALARALVSEGTLEDARIETL
jgi:phage terminase large subunit-like protein